MDVARNMGGLTAAVHLALLSHLLVAADAAETACKISSVAQGSGSAVLHSSCNVSTAVVSSSDELKLTASHDVVATAGGGAVGLRLDNNGVIRLTPRVQITSDHSDAAGSAGGTLHAMGQTSNGGELYLGGDQVAGLRIGANDHGSTWEIWGGVMNAGESPALHFQAMNSNRHFAFYQTGDTAQPALKIDVGSGNIGVGTSSPQAKLHVMGDVRVGDGALDAMQCMQLGALHDCTLRYHNKGNVGREFWIFPDTSSGMYTYYNADLTATWQMTNGGNFNEVIKGTFFGHTRYASSFHKMQEVVGSHGNGNGGDLSVSPVTQGSGTDPASGSFIKLRKAAGSGASVGFGWVRLTSTVPLKAVEKPYS